MMRKPFNRRPRVREPDCPDCAEYRRIFSNELRRELAMLNDRAEELDIAVDEALQCAEDERSPRVLCEYCRDALAEEDAYWQAVDNAIDAAIEDKYDPE